MAFQTRAEHHCSTPLLIFFMGVVMIFGVGCVFTLPLL
jgi:hypothetical protein